MGELLLKILDWFKEAYELIIPWYILPEFDSGVIMRFGIYHRNGRAGIHLKWPLVEDLLSIRNTTATINVKPQSLTTSDEKNIIISAVIKYNISDAKTFLLKVDEATDAITDLAQGKIKNIVINKTWDECKGIKDTELRDSIKPEAIKWGITIQLMTITDLALVRSIRLIS